MNGRRRGAGKARWFAFSLTVVLLMAVIHPAALSAAPASKTYTITGLIDCGRASGQACEFGDTIRVRTIDLTGHEQVIVVDITWIKKVLASFQQDDEIILEIEERPDGGYQAINLTQPDKTKVTAKKDEDDKPNTVLSGPKLEIDDVTVTQTQFLAWNIRNLDPDGNGNLASKVLTVSDIPGEVLTVSAIPIEVPTVTATFTVYVLPPSDSPVTVRFKTRDGSAVGGSECDFDTDYISRSGTLTFAPGQSKKTIDVTVCPGFGGEENTEQFFVDLTQPQNAAFGDPLGVGTIEPGEGCIGRNDDDDVADGFLAKLGRC